MDETSVGSQEPSAAIEATQETSSWTQSLAEDIRGEASLSKFKDVSSLAKSYLHAEKMIGGSVRIPNESSTPEEREAFYSKLSSVNDVVRIPQNGDEKALAAVFDRLGRPPSPTEYKLDLASGETAETPEIANFLSKCHASGMTQKQIDTVMSRYNELIDNSLEEIENYGKYATDLLTKEWGNEFQANLSATKVAVNAMMQKYPEDMKKLLSGPTANNPALVSLLAQLGKQTREGNAINNDSNFGFNGSKEQARAEIEKIKSAGANHPAWNPRDPGHRRAVQEMDELYRKAYL